MITKSTILNVVINIIAVIALSYAITSLIAEFFPPPKGIVWSEKSYNSRCPAWSGLDSQCSLQIMTTDTPTQNIRLDANRARLSVIGRVIVFSYNIAFAKPNGQEIDPIKAMLVNEEVYLSVKDEKRDALVSIQPVDKNKFFVVMELAGLQK